MERLHRILTRRSSVGAGSSPPEAAPRPPVPARVVRRQFRSLARERKRGFGTCGAPGIDAVALYEVEFPQAQSAGLEEAPVGIDLETDFYGNHAVIKQVSSRSPAAALPQRYLRPGHVVVAVNRADVSEASFEQVVQAVRTASSPLVIRFLDPEVMPLSSLTHEPVLANRDEYGFAKCDEHILSHRQRLRLRQRSDYQCELDWTRFISRWGGIDRIESLLHRPQDTDPPSISTLQIELRELVMRGVPAILRAQVWAALANVRAYRSRFPANHFAQLSQRPLPAATSEDIDKDVARTYPEHAYFRSERGRSELRTLLSAYALHNPEIGYCQAMNFIAGMLLLFADVERAFWLLCALLRDDDSAGGGARRLLPAANYSRSMTGTQADQLVFRSLVRLELPAVAARSDAHGLHLELFMLHWFMCAFVCTLPTATALRVWDWLFLDGQEVLFTTAIGVLKLAEPRMLGASSVPAFHTVIKTLGTDLHDEDELMAFLQRISARTLVDPAVGIAGDQLHDGRTLAPDNRPNNQVVTRRLSWLLPSFHRSAVATSGFVKKHTLEDIDRLRRDFEEKLALASFSSLQASM